MISILFFTFSRVFAENCEEFVQNALKFRFKPRFDTFSNGYFGFDYLGNYDECNQSNKKQFVLFKGYFKGTTRILLGLCAPVLCEKKYILEKIQQFVRENNYHEDFPDDKFEIYFPRQFSNQPFSFIGIFVVLMLLFYGLFILYSTFIDHLGGPKSDYLMLFSLKKNLKDLCELPKQGDFLVIFNGIRVCSSTLLIFLHTFMFDFEVSVTNKMNQYQSLSGLFANTMIVLTYTVDIFFFLSGFLLGFLSSNHNLTYIKYMIKRLVRHIPVYYFVLIVDFLLIKYMSSGPQWPLIEEISPQCEKYWPTNFLFIQNLIATTNEPCKVWTWTMSADFQMYLFSYLILWCYSKNKTSGYLLCFTFILLSMIYTGLVSYLYGFNLTFTHGFSQIFQMNIIYFRPWTRVSSYIIGIILGLIFMSHKHTEKISKALFSSFGEKFEQNCMALANNCEIRKILYLFGVFFMSIGFSGLILDYKGKNYLSQTTQSVILAIQRPLFTLGFSFWIFPALIGHNEFLRKILSLKFFSPLAKTSFALYLVHPLVYKFLFFSSTQAYFSDTKSWLYHTFFTVFYGNICAFFIYICIENPLCCFFSRLSKKKLA